MTQHPEPQGVIAIFTDEDGRVIATAADFNRSGVGGCTLWDAQSMRVRRAVGWKVIEAYSPALAKHIDDYLVEQLCRKLLSNGGHRMTFRAIGYPDDVAREVERR